jgi:hypothetical protein
MTQISLKTKGMVPQLIVNVVWKWLTIFLGFNTTNTIYSKNANGEVIITPVSDIYLQCHECGTVYPSYEVKQEGKLSDVVELPDSPAHFGKIAIKSIYESRKYAILVGNFEILLALTLLRPCRSIFGSQ